MATSKTDYGKAFEYACIYAFANGMTKLKTPIEIISNEPLHTAHKNYARADACMQNKFNAAAEAAFGALCHLEPTLTSGHALEMLLQSDAAGMRGDVRDMICRTSSGKWEIGLSCKHNNDAVKHSRLSATIDFGNDWLGTPCSQRYFQDIAPYFDKLRSLRDCAKAKGDPPPYWSEMPNKEDAYYRPVLDAFIDEFKRLDSAQPDKVSAALIRYLVGQRDFYKVASSDSARTTRVTAFNFDGTLFASAAGVKSQAPKRKLKLPSKVLWIGFLPGSNNTLEVHCDEGWAVSLRIHNASKQIEPSLKFDVRLVGHPALLYTEVARWS